MTTGTIDRHQIIQFSTMMHVKAQQIKSRLREHVQILPMTGDQFAYDGLGQVEATEVNGTIVPVAFSDIEHNRRLIARRRFVINLPVDNRDVRGMLTDPSGKYAEACIRGMERQFDRVGIDAAFADVKTGRNFENTVTATTDGVQLVDATLGLTYEKLLRLKRNWTNKEVGTDVPEDFMLLVTGTETEAMMQEQELISGDFSRKFVVDNGEIVVALGMQLVPYGADVPNPALIVNGSGERRNIAMSKRAIAYGMSKEMGITVEKRTDFVELKQVQITAELGATRTEGVLLQEFRTTA